jgi:hypothetical protein
MSDPTKWKTPRMKTIRAFDEWKLDEENLAEFFRQIVEERKRMRDACVAVGQPYRLMYPFLHDGGVMQKRYEAALAAVGDDLMHERLQRARELRESKTEIPAHVMAAKLECDVLESTASKWEPARYGEKESQRGGGIQVYVDRSCGGSVQISAGGATARIPLGNSPEALPAIAENSTEKMEI